jgi:hypothetical protein
MKKKNIAFITLITSISLMIIPSFCMCIVTADPSDHFPLHVTDEVIVNALDFLRVQQSEDDGIGGFIVSSWAAMAIAASGERPEEWGNLIEYLQETIHQLDEDKATDWERMTLAIVCCDRNPREFGGMDFVEQIENFFDGEQIGNEANIYDDVFGTLALVASGGKQDSFLIQTVCMHIKEKQREDGGWGDVDSTSAAIMALISAGEPASSASIRQSLAFLKTAQDESGGFQSWGTVNAASTAWAVSALVAAHEDPTSQAWKQNEKTPVDFLIDLQEPDGSFKWTVEQRRNPEWMTSYVLSALLGKPYPVITCAVSSSEEEEWTGSVRIEGSDTTIWTGEVTVGSSVIYAYNVSSGATEEFVIPYPSILGTLDSASQIGGFSYVVHYYPDWDAFYVQAIENDEDWWHYWADYSLPMVGAGQYHLSEDDHEILWGYLEDWYAQALRIFVDKESVHPSMPVTVTVTNETLSPVEEAVVTIDGINYVTDEQGEVSIYVTTEGSYDIGAEKEGYVRSELLTLVVELKVDILQPEENAFYFNNRKNPLPWKGIFIIGFIDVTVYADEEVSYVEFYVNDEHLSTDTSSPFAWRWNERSLFTKTLHLKGYLSDGTCIEVERDVFMINLFPRLHPEM